MGVYGGPTQSWAQNPIASNWYRERSGVVTNGLIMALDAGIASSYLTTTTSWIDLSGSNNNGTLVNGPTYRTDNGGIVSLDGSNDYVSTSYTQTSITQYTIESWFKSTDSGAQNAIVQNRGSGSGRSITMGMGPIGGPVGKIFIGVDSDGLITQIATTNNYNDGNWYHAVGIFNQSSGTITGNSFSIYINGTLASTTTGGMLQVNSVSSPVTGLGGTLIGYHQAWGTFFLGSLGLVRIYNRALTAAEIQQNFNATRSRYGI